MSLPDYETLMRPVLDAVADGQATHIRDVRVRVATALSLGDEDLTRRIPSGARMFDNRVHWAVTYLVQAGVIRRPQRGYVELSSRGRELLESNPSKVDNRLLSRYPEFVDFQTRARGVRSSTADSSDPVVSSDGLPSASGVTPLEQLSISVDEANAAVAAEVLERVLTQSPEFLERLVLRLLTAMGYGGREGAAEHLGRSGDQGLDGVIRQDALGLDRVYIQAKRYASEHAVGRPDIQAFVGALHGAQADRGVFITTSRFTPEARAYADRVPARLVLMDGDRLAELMVLHNVGVQDEESFVLKRLDEDFFDESTS